MKTKFMMHTLAAVMISLPAYSASAEEIKAPEQEVVVTEEAPAEQNFGKEVNAALEKYKAGTLGDYRNFGEWVSEQRRKKGKRGRDTAGAPNADHARGSRPDTAVRPARPGGSDHAKDVSRPSRGGNGGAKGGSGGDTSGPSTGIGI